jgi:uncharacterized protein
MRRTDREITGILEIEEIIRKCDVCRVAMSDGTTPYIVTMNFGYMGGPARRIYFHCAREGRKLDVIRKNNHVCFEMDTDHVLYKGESGCDWGMNFKSIVGFGLIRELNDINEKIEGLNSLMSHYSGKEEFTYNPGVLERTVVLRLDIMEMTCKKK